MLSGASIVRRQLVRNLRSVTEQQQPCGVDLTLLRVHAWTSPATIDFDNTRRQAANTTEIFFEDNKVKLGQGAYRVDFNETVQMPRDCMGSLFTRSTLWRSGVIVHAGVVDAGYEGALGAVIEVKNSAGVYLLRGAKLAQMVVHPLEEAVEGYRGIYQSSADSAGLDGKGIADETVQ
ncbi:dUTPase-like protein [Staphylotrichum tortipilum]|uniref:dUTPase-like protein n=1 Tax=Staphylotrichum tortipilum TaxID=2831512 RepID=A0AAN6RME2_9PEZI|nr:dUTPase-like protein [Staphylotrichum longicolle]